MVLESTLLLRAAAAASAALLLARVLLRFLLLLLLARIVVVVVVVVVVREDEVLHDVVVAALLPRRQFRPDVQPAAGSARGARSRRERREHVLVVHPLELFLVVVVLVAVAAVAVVVEVFFLASAVAAAAVVVVVVAVRRPVAAAAHRLRPAQPHVHHAVRLRALAFLLLHLRREFLHRRSLVLPVRGEKRAHALGVLRREIRVVALPRDPVAVPLRGVHDRPRHLPEPLHLRLLTESLQIARGDVRELGKTGGVRPLVQVIAQRREASLDDELLHRGRPKLLLRDPEHETEVRRSCLRAHRRLVQLAEPEELEE
eukprot:30911-Pelagococcus_subviridis.AAC.8